jgi:anti-sigma factor RsiW
MRERLEEYLSGRLSGAALREAEDHLAACQACRRRIEEMRRHSQWLRTLRAAGETDPAPGFYARVLDRIESQRSPSVWSLFLEPAFARRLAYASLALLLVLGSLIVAGTPPDPVAYSPDVIMSEKPVAQFIGDDEERDREVVLVNLATYEY